jgi:hypothetical protein
VAANADEEIDRLYGLEQGEFTAERDALAKRLRKDDRAAAERVKALRKPVTAAWAVNQVARGRPKVVGELLKAGDALRDAQAKMLSGGDRDIVRRAVEEERDWVERVVEEARAVLSGGDGKATPATLDAIRQTLHAAATSEDVRELVRSGRLVEEQSAAGFGLGDAPAAPAKPKPAKPKPQKKQPAKGRVGAPSKADEKRRRDDESKRRAEEKRLRERLASARKDLTAARREERDAEKGVERAQKALDKARDQTARREQVLRAAEAKAP